MLQIVRIRFLFPFVLFLSCFVLQAEKMMSDWREFPLSQCLGRTGS